MEYKPYNGYVYWHDWFYRLWFAGKMKNNGTANKQFKAKSQEQIRKLIDKEIRSKG